ncbi:hypothetical protein [Pseudovibrio sp. Ad26]|uniref:hypothetical protein n=1 Tax=Pseudovibrio sp. Ad26 TaxID=989410 RepID=UPI00187C1A43|nr:hypothetical protein [Pseudovibrio sp. Ad26]
MFDNDAVGVETYEKTKRLELPESYRVEILPNLGELEKFPTIGPTGESEENINGRAAAIECYLDLKRACLPRIKVEWGAKKQKSRPVSGRA